MINPEDQGGRIETHGGGTGEISAGMIRQRALELAIQEGRDTAREDDLQRARLELEGIAGVNSADDETVDTVAGEHPPDEPVGSYGTMTDRVTTDEDEVPAERLIQEGLDEAEHERMTQAEREQRRQAE